MWEENGLDSIDRTCKEQLVEMDEINPRIENLDIAVVIGAKSTDTVNDKLDGMWSDTLDMT